MKSSGSKIRIGRGSMSHIGTTPCKYKIDVFVSYIENVKNASQVCITWERRGKVQATSVVKVKDGKAVLRETMSMDSTLFKRNMKDKGKKGQADKDYLKFDEKKVKFVLRKGGPDGKAIGKISMDIAEYVRGVNGTVFADLKLSNGSIIVSKIEATMLHMGRLPKNDSKAGSETYSEMSESYGLDSDSLFGEDEDEDEGEDSEIPFTVTPPPKSEADVSSTRAAMSPTSMADISSSNLTVSPTSTTSCTSAQKSPSARGLAASSSQRNMTEREATETEIEAISKRRSVLGVFHVSKQREGDLKPSPSLRQKLKNKIKSSGKKESEEDAESSEITASTRKPKASRTSTNEAEIKELRLLVESLKEENAKLRKGKQAAMDEIDALRSDLEACENALEESTQNAGDNNTGTCGNVDATSLDEKDKRIAQLSSQNQSLIEELEELHQGDVKTNQAGKKDKDTIKALRKRIAELEVALRREPQFLDVANELKVTKVSLALANMEREQAVFALNTLKQDLGVDD